MGYLFLGLSLISGLTKGFCGKKTSGFVTEYKDALFTNVMRMVLCIVIGFMLIALQGNINLLSVDVTTILITLLSGVTTSVFVVSWLLIVRKGAYMMLDVFLTMGVIVPLVLSNIFFSETIRINQWAGLAVLLVAVIIMCSYNNSIKEKITPGSLCLLILCGVSNGLTDFSQKMFMRVTGGDAAVFNFYTYVFSAAVLVVLYLFERSKGDVCHSTKSLVKSVGGYIIIMAVCLFANSYFKTIASSYLSAVVLYPLNSGCGLILSSFMSAIFFKERLTSRAVLGIILAFAGLLIINLL